MLREIHIRIYNFQLYLPYIWLFFEDFSKDYVVLIAPVEQHLFVFYDCGSPLHMRPSGICLTFVGPMFENSLQRMTTELMNC